MEDYCLQLTESNDYIECNIEWGDESWTYSRVLMDNFMNFTKFKKISIPCQ